MKDDSDKNDLKLFDSHPQESYRYVVALSGAARMIFNFDAGVLFLLFSLLMIMLLELALLVRERNKSKLTSDLVSIMTKTAGGGCWEWHIATGRFSLVPGGLSLFGKEVFTYDDLMALVHPDDANLLRRWLDRFRTSGSDKAGEVEFRTQGAGGNWRWFVARKGSVEYASDKIVRVRGALLDIGAYKELMEAMRASERRIATIFKSAPGSMAVTDVSGRLIDANQAFYDMLGYSAEALHGIPIMSLSDTRHDQESDAVMANILAKCESYEDNCFHLEEDFVCSNGERITLDYGLSAILDFDGNVLNYVFSGIDITLQKKRAAELDTYTQQLQQLHSLIHSLLRTRNRDHLLEGMMGYLKNVVTNSACSIYLFNSTNEKTRENANLRRLAWYDEDDIAVPDSGHVLEAVVSGVPFVEKSENGLETRRILPLVFQTNSIGAVDLYKPSGMSSAELKMYQLLVDYVAGFWMLYDLMAMREEEAFIDALTGIWNRRYMIRRLQEESDRILRYGGNACLVIGDMGNFKHTNDNYGHTKGDEVLVMSAAAIKRSVRLTDSVGRYGGDEFILLLPNVSKADAESVINRIRQELERIQVRSDDSDPDSPFISVIMDFGFAFFPGDAPTALDAINLADDVMYACKQERKAKSGIKDQKR